MRTLCSALLAGAPGRAEELDAFEQAQAALVADLGQLKTQILENCARSDPLTGLPLRHRLESKLRALPRAGAAQRAVAGRVMLADVDHFKQVNDQHGHAVGDQALRHLAGVLRGAARGGEPVFRYGGEEFLGPLQAADRDAAEQAAERLLQALRDAPMPLSGGAALALRLSAGLARAGADEAMAAVVERADRAMYEAQAQPAATAGAGTATTATDGPRRGAAVSGGGERAQHPVHRREQQRQVQRLGHVVGEAGGDRPRQVVVHRVRAHCDDRDWRARSSSRSRRSTSKPSMRGSWMSSRIIAGLRPCASSRPCSRRARQR